MIQSLESPPRHDRTGEQHGLITVIGFSHWKVYRYDLHGKVRHAHWRVRCTCGVERTMKACDIVRDVKTHIGCRRKR